MSTSSWGIFDQWRKGLLGFSDPNEDGTFGSSTDFSAMDSDLRPPPKNIYDNNWNKVKNYALGDEKQIGPQQIRDKSQAWSDIKKTGKKVYNALPGGDYDKKWAIDQANKNKINAAQNNNAIPFHPSQGGTSQNLAGNQDPKWWEKLAKMAGVDPDKAMASWKDKGGFEGLMANPAFTMGLAFMQAGAEGKTLGAGALDNVMKAGGISQHYKKIIEDRKQKPIEATAADVSDVKDLMATLKVEEPNWWEKAAGFIFEGDTGQAGFDQAAEQIASEVQKRIESMQRKHKGKEPFVIDIDLKKKVIKEVLASGKIKHKKSWSRWTSGTVKSTSENPFKARGGPVQAGKPYVVGEEGPEVIIPRSDGNVLSNDDSQIYAMLLASNPQLQKVSRARAERILRTRFPEYFE